MFPVSNTPGSVALWAIESEFNQLTDWPAFTITGLGEYRPFVIVTVSRLGGFVPSGFVGEIGEVGLFELPQAAASSPSRKNDPTVDRLAIVSLAMISGRCNACTGLARRSWLVYGSA